MKYDLLKVQSGYKEAQNYNYDIIFDVHSPINNDLLEIIITTYKRPNLLNESIESALNQNCNRETLITILDNDPTPVNESLELVKNRFLGKIRYIKNSKNYGMVGNWNLALRIAKCTYFCLLHDDDLLNDKFLYYSYKFILKFQKFGILSNQPYILSVADSKFAQLSSKGYIFQRLLRNRYRKVHFKDFFYGNMTSACALIINRNLAIEVGGWSKFEYPSHDYFFNARMAYRISSYIYNLKNPTSIYRVEVNESLSFEVQSKWKSQKYLFIKENLKLLNLINVYKFKLMAFLEFNQFTNESLKYKSSNIRFAFDSLTKLFLKILYRNNQFKILLKSRKIKF